MKLQNLAVIFIIIVIPIILVLSYYMSLQRDTINMQTSYNTKLLESTKEAIEAFEINTVEWNEAYSETADSKRRDVMASINTFITSFANNIGVGGTSKEDILSYIPAVAFIGYDGYYIYAPATVEQTVKDKNGVTVFYTEKLAKSATNPKITTAGGYNPDDNDKILYIVQDGIAPDGTYTYKKEDGTIETKEYTLNPDNAKETYQHTLSQYIPYSANYKDESRGINIVVNYTLDNYITITGEVNGKYVIKSGYLQAPNMTRTYDSGRFGAILNIRTMSGASQRVTVPWTLQKLSEEISFIDVSGTLNTGVYNYVYDSTNCKVYFETSGETFIIGADQKKYYLNDLGEVRFKKSYNSGTALVDLEYILQALNDGYVTCMDPRVGETSEYKKWISKSKICHSFRDQCCNWFLHRCKTFIACR